MLRSFSFLIQALLNLDIIPSPEQIGMSPLGQGIGHTVFATLMRVAVCKDKSLCSQYFSAVSGCLLLQRL